ncbi:hypothetical protein [Priestia megaterium]|uniref:hypothetical protein n=1 Tax=Priestia megaterium TaxID=1404 RepID=UPI0030001EE6
MEWIYWKVVMRYGHVGRQKEVSVARYLVTPSNMTIIDVLNIAEDMPGTKNRATISVCKVDLMEYLAGKREEKENLFLRQLINKVQ